MPPLPGPPLPHEQPGDRRGQREPDDAGDDQRHPPIGTLLLILVSLLRLLLAHVALVLLRADDAPSAAARRAGAAGSPRPSRRSGTGPPQHALDRALHRGRQRQAGRLLGDAREVALGADGDGVVVEDVGGADDWKFFFPEKYFCRYLVLGFFVSSEKKQLPLIKPHATSNRNSSPTFPRPDVGPVGHDRHPAVELPGPQQHRHVFVSRDKRLRVWHDARTEPSARGARRQAGGDGLAAAEDVDG